MKSYLIHVLVFSLFLFCACSICNISILQKSIAEEFVPIMDLNSDMLHRQNNNNIYFQNPNQNPSPYQNQSNPNSQQGLINSETNNSVYLDNTQNPIPQNNYPNDFNSNQPTNEEKQNDAMMQESIKGSNHFEIEDANIPLLLEAIKSNPKNMQELFNRGFAKYKVQDYTGALSDFDAVIKANSELVGEAYLYRGRCKKALNDISGAVIDLKQSLHYSPDSANVYIKNGLVNEEAKDFSAAIDQYNKALEYKKDSLEAYLHRGFAKAQLGKYSEALTDLNKAINLDTKNPESYKIRGYIRYMMRDYNHSIDDYEKSKVLYQEKKDLKAYQNAIQSINLLREIMTHQE